VQIPAWKRVIRSAEDSGSVAGSWFSTLLYCGFAFGMFYFALFRWRELVPILITGCAWGVSGPRCTAPSSG
jgi:hypothetical protein